MNKITTWDNICNTDLDLEIGDRAMFPEASWIFIDLKVV